MKNESRKSIRSIGNVKGLCQRLKDYVNENWDEEYRNDIDDVNDMYVFIVAALSVKSVVGSATINGKTYIISEEIE